MKKNRNDDIKRHRIGVAVIRKLMLLALASVMVLTCLFVYDRMSRDFYAKDMSMVPTGEPVSIPNGYARIVNGDLFLKTGDAMILFRSPSSGH